MTRSLAVVIFIFAFNRSSVTHAESRSAESETQEKTVQFDQLYQACAKGTQRDQICNAIVQIKQIGDDTVEAVKAFIPLGPFEYAVLTAGNFAITGRLRIRPQKLINKDWENTIDYRREGRVDFVIERNF